MLSAGGELRLSRRYYWLSRQSACPADTLLGIEGGRVSPGAREICCRLALACDFRQAACDACRIGGIRLCRERLRQLAEAEAAAVTRRREGRELAAGSAPCAAEGSALPAAWSAEGKDLYVGVDGLLAPTVTEAEKKKRRASHVARRAARVRHGKGNSKPLPPRNKGTDQRYKEVKLGLFYDQEKEHRHGFVTCRGPEHLGSLLRGQGKLIDLEKARQKRSVTDAAAWILRQLRQCLPMLDGSLIDFYHLATHVHDAAEASLGETRASPWALEQLHVAKHRGPAALLERVDTLRKQVRSTSGREAVRKLRGYVQEHEALMNYPKEIAAGRDIGSGPTEAMCKTLSQRIKGTGMRWDLEHVQDMMNLRAMYESGQAECYWMTLAN